MNFWEQFWPQILATLIGVGIGIPAGIALNSLIEGSTRREKKYKILLLLSDELEVNGGVLDSWASQSSADLKAGTLDLQLIDETWRAFSQGGELQWIRDLGLLFDLYRAYSRIRIVQKYSRKHYEIALQGGSGTNNNYGDFIYSQFKKEVDYAATIIRGTTPELTKEMSKARSKVTRFKIFFREVIEKFKHGGRLAK